MSIFQEDEPSLPVVHLYPAVPIWEKEIVLYLMLSSCRRFFYLVFFGMICQLLTGTISSNEPTSFLSDKEILLVCATPVHTKSQESCLLPLSVNA
jgi:hypothetical protein